MTSLNALEDIVRLHDSEKSMLGQITMGNDRIPFLRGIGKNKRILDIGCRDGALTQTYMEGNTVVGLDIDAVALEDAKAKGIEAKHVDLNGDWGLTEKFDAVVAGEVIEHLFLPKEVTRKIASVLKPDGALYGSVPNALPLKARLYILFGKKHKTDLNNPTHINHFTVKELSGILSKYFKHVDIYGRGRLGFLARWFPQTFAFILLFEARYPKQ